TPIGDPGPTLAAATARQQRLHASDRPVQVDLGLDLTVRLPEVVRTEIEQAVETLCAVGGGTIDDPIAQYRRDFIARYGTGRAVPLADLLSPDPGLGAPAGYTLPHSTRMPHAVPAEPDPRDAVLAAIAQRVAVTGEREIELDDDLLDRLSGDGVPPRS